jgi:hypothetical protein
VRHDKQRESAGAQAQANALLVPVTHFRLPAVFVACLEFGATAQLPRGLHLADTTEAKGCCAVALLQGSGSGIVAGCCWLVQPKFSLEVTTITPQIGSPEQPTLQLLAADAAVIKFDQCCCCQ